MHEIDLIQTWLDSVALGHSGAKNTETLYRYGFNLFLKYINAQPRDIAQDYEQMPEKLFRHKYAELLRSWSGHLKRQDLTPSSIGNYVKTVQSFFKHNDYPLGFVQSVQKRVVYHNRDITREEILAILGMSAPREKAFYAIMAQSGLRPTTLCNLKIKNLEPDFSANRVPLKITVPEEIAKGKYHEYITFMAEDAARLLRDYLNTRRNLTAESLLFVNYGTEDPMIYNSMSSLFRKAVRLLREKGLMKYEQRKADRPAEIRLYTLRKWFRKMAIQAGFENVDYWMGHTGPGVDASYRPSDPEFYRTIYAEKAIPFLRLEATTPSEVEKTMEAQAEQINLLRAELYNERTTRANLEERLGSIEKILAQMKKTLD